jgi:putative membrane protein
MAAFLALWMARLPRRRLWWALAVALAVVALEACAQAPAPAAPPAPPPDAAPPRALSEADRRVVIEAAASGLYRLEAARMAELRATDPMLKAYASMLVLQNSVAHEELRALATGRGVAWMGGPPANRRGALQVLAGLSGEAFDRRFVEQVGVSDHQADLVVLEAAVRSVEDAALRAWLERMVATLQNHLATAQQLPLRTQPQA